MKKIGIFVGVFTISLLLTGCGTNYSKLEDSLKEKASKYYEDNIKDKVLNVNNHKITLEALETADVNIEEFIDAKCDKTSYALIKLTLDEEGKQKGNYTVENHLTCGDYETGSK